MLRWSSTQAGTPADLGVVTGDVADDLPHERELVAFVDAAAGGDDSALDAARFHLADVTDPAFMIDAAAVVAAFEMFTRVVDGTGGRFDPATAPARAALDADLGIRSLVSTR